MKGRAHFIGWRALLLAVALLALLALGACRAAPKAGSTSNPVATGTPEARASVPEEPMVLVWEVWRLLQKEYVDKAALDPEKLSQGAIAGMLKALGDPSITAVPAISDTPSMPRGAPAELRPVWDAWAAIFQTQGVKKTVDGVALSEGAVEGLLEALDDPHTEYIDPTHYKFQRESFQGNYEGIGAEIYQQGARLILNPMPSSPAEQVGLRAGDALLAVNGESVEGWTLLETVSRIRGPKGSAVRLQIQHLGDQVPVEVEVIRGVIELRSLFWNMTNDDFAYLRLMSFYDNTGRLLQQELPKILEERPSGIVLDLRGNPGGFLSVVVDVASQFLKDGLVVYEVDGYGKRTDWRVRKGGMATDFPMVVLVDQFSASGSEVLAGALQDYGRAKLVGLKTFGKGSVNLLKGLEDGGGLYYTYARWYTPKGRQIDRHGLEPDVEVTQLAGRPGDRQLEKALEVLRTQVGLPTSS